MSRSRLVARNVAATLATQILSWGLSFAVTLYLPSYLGSHGLGVLTLAGSFAGIFSIGVGLGTSTVLTRDIARDPERVGEMTLAALLLRLPLGLLAIAMAWGVARGLGYTPFVSGIILVAVAAMLAGLLNDVLGAALGGLQEIPRRNLAALADKFVVSGLTILLVMRHAPWWMLAAAGGISACVSLAINASAFMPYWKTLRLPSWDTMRLLARQGLPFLTTAIFVSVYGNCDALLMSKLSSFDAIGWYGLAKRLGGTTMFIPFALTSAMLPALANLHQNDRGAFDAAARRMFNFLVICAVPFAAVLIMAPGQIIALVTQKQASFAPAAPVLMIMGMAIILWFLSQAAATVLIASDRQGALSRITAISALVCVPVTGSLIFLTQRTLHNGALGALLGDALIEAYMVSAYLRALSGAGTALPVSLTGAVSPRWAAPPPPRCLWSGCCISCMTETACCCWFPACCCMFPCAGCSGACTRRTCRWRVRCGKERPASETLCSDLHTQPAPGCGDLPADSPGLPPG